MNSRAKFDEKNIRAVKINHSYVYDMYTISVLV